MVCVAETEERLNQLLRNGKLEEARALGKAAASRPELVDWLAQTSVSLRLALAAAISGETVLPPAILDREEWPGLELQLCFLEVLGSLVSSNEASKTAEKLADWYKAARSSSFVVACQLMTTEVPEWLRPVAPSRADVISVLLAAYAASSSVEPSGYYYQEAQTVGGEERSPTFRDLCKAAAREDESLQYAAVVLELQKCHERQPEEVGKEFLRLIGGTISKLRVTSCLWTRILRNLLITMTSNSLRLPVMRLELDPCVYKKMSDEARGQADDLQVRFIDPHSGRLHLERSSGEWIDSPESERLWAAYEQLEMRHLQVAECLGRCL